MTSRVDLKKLFRVGARPTDKDFGELIDSALIMDDEGFHKTPADGLKIDALGDSGALLSLQWSDPQIPGWSFEFADKPCGELVFRRAWAGGGGAAPAAGESGADATAPDSPFPLKLQDSAPRGAGGESGRLVVDGEPAPTLRLGTTAQATVLEVDGAVRASGRAGSQALVPADGKFHEITGDLRGCTAFEVTAGVGSPGEGRFALLHGVALNTYNPSLWGNLFFFFGRGIRCHHAFYARRSDRLQLRWAPASDSQSPAEAHGADARYVLQIRSRTSYAKAGASGAPQTAPQIRASVSQLWFDPQMTSAPFVDVDKT